MAILSPFRVQGADLVVAVRLTPKGGRDAIGGIGALPDGRAVLLARVRAVPEDGKANAALVQLLADEFSVPKRAVRFQSGESARLKMLVIEDAGQRAAELAERYG